MRKISPLNQKTSNYLNIAVFAVFFFLSLLQLNAQNTYSEPNLEFRKSNYSFFKIELDSNTYKKFSLVQNNVSLTHKEFIEERIANNSNDFFAINACINDDQKQPLGLFISNKQQTGGLNNNSGSGNFFLKPNGVFIASDREVAVKATEEVVNLTNIHCAVQSGPMLIINDSIHPSFNPNSTNKNIRCGVGTFTENNKKYLVFCSSNEPVTFFQFASLFKEYFHCSNALCLESANSVMYSPDLGIKNADETKVVGNYIIYNNNAGTNTTGNHQPSVVYMKMSQGGVYEIPVELNGVLKISFIFDSGASDVSISPDVALTLMRTGTITDNDYIGQQRYVFADGSTAVSDVFYLQEVKVGDYTIKKVRASISNTLEAPMLLGQTVMQRMGKFSIDNNNHTLIIE